MILQVSTFLETLSFPVVLNLLISLGLAFVSFFFAFTMKKKCIGGSWFTSLRHILSIMAVSALGNAYSIVLLGYTMIHPSQVLLLLSVLVLMFWSCAYYVRNIRGPGTSLTEEKVLKFIQNEHRTPNKIEFDN